MLLHAPRSFLLPFPVSAAATVAPRIPHLRFLPIRPATAQFFLDSLQCNFRQFFQTFPAPDKIAVTCPKRSNCSSPITKNFFSVNLRSVQKSIHRTKHPFLFLPGSPVKQLHVTNFTVTKDCRISCASRFHPMFIGRKINHYSIAVHIPLLLPLLYEVVLILIPEILLFPVDKSS